MRAPRLCNRRTLRGAPCTHPVPRGGMICCTHRRYDRRHGSANAALPACGTSPADKCIATCKHGGPCPNLVKVAGDPCWIHRPGSRCGGKGKRRKHYRRHRADGVPATGRARVERGLPAFDPTFKKEVLKCGFIHR